MTDKKSNKDKSKGYWGIIFKRLRKNHRAMIGLCFVAAMFLVTIFSPLLANDKPIICKYNGEIYMPGLIQVLQTRDIGDHWVNIGGEFDKPYFDVKKALEEDEDSWAVWPLIPFGEYEIDQDCGTWPAPPSTRHWLGTDHIGRDLASRMIHGTSVAVRVGFISMGIAAAIGIFIGGLAGYFGGWVDILISRIIEIVICFPLFFLILIIMVWLEPNINNVMIVIGLTRWTSIARYTRGEFMRLKNADYVLAAKSLGFGDLRIMFKHMLPNSLAPVMVSITFGIAAAILTEAGLSWLGFGVQPPAPSWGNILRVATSYLQTAPHLMYPPCVAIFLGVFSYNLVGDALRDAIDPRLKNR